MSEARATVAMQVDTFGEGQDLVWVMGWGNRADSRHERWFVDRLAAADYRVHAAEIPTNGTDFEADYLAPVRDYRTSVDDHRLVAHSMGGLVVAHLEPDDDVVYLGPWWGMAGEPPLVAELLFRLPTARPVIPTPIDPAALGGLATEADRTAPDRLSPAWIRTMRDAQASLPPLGDGDVVFYSPDDQVVDPAAVERHATANQRHAYDGGHELFASEGREGLADRVVEALER
jgi:predicted alpha/beta hydrolase family esterase